MMHELDVALSEAGEAIADVERCKKRLRAIHEEYNRATRKKTNAFLKLKKENKDVDKIMGLSMASFVATLLNNRSEKIEKEELEAIEAKYAYDSSVQDVEAIQTEMERLERVVANEKAVKETYDAAFDAKKNDVLRNSPEAWTVIKANELNCLSIDIELKEINEAIVAAEVVSESIQSALHELNKAKDLGVFDMLGGGLLVTLAKRNHMDAAQTMINRMNQHLKTFSRELKDINQDTALTVDIGSYLSFGDLFFDGLFIDMFVQNKIHEVLETIKNVKRDVSKLSLMMTEMKQEKLEKKEQLVTEINKQVLNHK